MVSASPVPSHGQNPGRAGLSMMYKLGERDLQEPLLLLASFTPCPLLFSGARQSGKAGSRPDLLSGEEG